MELIKKLWPFSFECKSRNDLILKAIAYLVLTIIFSLFISVFKDIIVLNVIMYIICPVADLYLFIGLVLLFLSYFKLIK